MTVVNARRPRHPFPFVDAAKTPRPVVVDNGEAPPVTRFSVGWGDGWTGMPRRFDDLGYERGWRDGSECRARLIEVRMEKARREMPSPRASLVLKLGQDGWENT